MVDDVSQVEQARDLGPALLQFFESLVGTAGFEPATLGLEIRCSIRLSYAPTKTNLTQL